MFNKVSMLLIEPWQPIIAGLSKTANNSLIIMSTYYYISTTIILALINGSVEFEVSYLRQKG